MIIMQMIAITVVTGLVLALAVVLILFNLKRVQIRKCAAKATDDELEAIYVLVEATST